MEFGLRIPPCEDPRQVADLALRAEQAGFGYACSPNTQSGSWTCTQWHINTIDCPNLTLE